MPKPRIHPMVVWAGLLAPLLGPPAWATPPPPRPGGHPTGEAEVEWIVTPRPAARLALPQRPGQAPPPEPDAPSGDWKVLLSDETFHQTLLRWSRAAGWQLVWEAERDFEIDAQVTLTGTFLQVLDQAMSTLQDTDYPVQARVNTSTRVLRVLPYRLDGDRR